MQRSGISLSSLFPLKASATVLRSSSGVGCHSWQVVPHLKQVCTPEHSLSSPALPIPSSLSSSAVEKGVETSHGGFQMVRVQLECEDGVQHCSFCIQIKDINSSGKSEPLASLVGFTNVKHADMSTAYGERSCTPALLYWCSCLCCHR